MDPSGYGALAGAGAGLLTFPEAKRKERLDRQLQAETAQFSPWTGLSPFEVKPKDEDLGNRIMQGATSGAAQGQKYQEAQDASQLSQAQAASMGGAGPGVPGAEAAGPAAGAGAAPVPTAPMPIAPLNAPAEQGSDRDAVLVPKKEYQQFSTWKAMRGPSYV